MLISMTGFGRATCDCSGGQVTIEIQSVNRKVLEISVSMPRDWNALELEIRKWIGEMLTRGQISVRISHIPDSQIIKTYLPDVEMLRALKKEWEQIAQQIGVSTDSITLPFLLQQAPQQLRQQAPDQKALHKG